MLNNVFITVGLGFSSHKLSRYLYYVASGHNLAVYLTVVFFIHFHVKSY